MTATIEQCRQNLKEAIGKHETLIATCKETLKRLETQKQPTMQELYNGMDDYFTRALEDTVHEHILGGDGRSQPWSEQRGGRVMTITIKEGIYLDGAQREAIKGYVASTSILSATIVFSDEIKEKQS